MASTVVIEKESEAIAEVLERHNVFGVERNALTAHEKKHFVGVVLRHVLDPNPVKEALVLSYKDTGARIELDTHVVAETALFSKFKVVPVLIPNPTLERDPKIDYEALTADIQFAREWLIME